MKVVLFCGGMGLRLREHSDKIPKPMAIIGERPILWHIMKYYAHFGHTEFILCLGWQGHVIKDYFLNYNECASNDFIMSKGGAAIDLISRDIDDWEITFVDTGVASSIGQRLMAVEPFLGDDQVFLANYADDLTDFPLPELIQFFHQQDALAALLAVRPAQSFHTVTVAPDGTVRRLQPITEGEVWMNGGYFVLHRQIFSYINQGEDLVGPPLDRLAAEGRLVALQYDGFWGSMDTFKEKQQLDEWHAQGITPWEVWKRPPQASQQRGQPARQSTSQPAVARDVRV